MEDAMKAEQLLTKAINTLNRWDAELEEEGGRETNLNRAMISILEYGINHLDNRHTTPVRQAIALAYAVLDSDA